ncbi:uncharacterized protein PRCAT00005839001 [Priceomyces carsonii]|uniref:uncharacterized protein n=1 Tax=Priceomyces carsonii TaxID=28549 RepID=UPI002ED9F863|nr:unnamed protein product [Priceomyces carsonii]
MYLLSSRRITKIRGSTPFIVTTVFLAVFSDTFMYGVIIPVIPFAFQSRMGVTKNDVESWISRSLAIYSVGLLLGSVIFGYACDRVNMRRGMMVGGLLVISASCIILCLTKSLPLYLVGRLIQGISAAVVWTVGLALIADTADSGQVAYLMAFPGIGVNLGFFAGPLIGGIVYEKSGYYSVYYVCFGLLFVDMVVRLLMLEKKELNKRMKKFDTDEQGEILEVSTLSHNSNEVNEAIENDKNCPQNLEENEIPSPLHYHIHSIDTVFGIKVPPIIGLLKHSTVVVSLFQAFVISWIMSAIETTLTLHLNEIFHFTSMGASLMTLPLAVSSFIEPFVGKMSDKMGPKFLVTLGFVSLIPFLIILRVPNHDSVNQIAMFAAFVALNGAAFSLIFSPIMGELCKIVSVVEAQNPGRFGPGKGMGQVYGLFNFSFSLGALIGPFHAGGVYLKVGWNTTVLSLGIMSAISSIPTFLFTGGNVISRWQNKDFRLNHWRETI